jgi:hypothetical protein
MTGIESDDESSRGVTLTYHFDQLSDYSILIVWRIENENRETVTVNVECESVLFVDPGKESILSDISWGRGFLIETIANTFSKINK